MTETFKSWLKKITSELVGIKDSPHKIALGFGLGVFLGILPGAGPIASVTLALLLRVNKAAALAGSLLTNTWLSIVSFALSVKIGSVLTGANWEEVAAQCKALLKDFHFKNIFDVTILEILKPLLVGYVVVGFLAGCVGYVVAYGILWRRRNNKSGRATTFGN